MEKLYFDDDRIQRLGKFPSPYFDLNDQARWGLLGFKLIPKILCLNERNEPVFCANKFTFTNGTGLYFSDKNGNPITFEIRNLLIFEIK